MFQRKLPALACALALVLIPLSGARAAAGGEITGTVTDPKGAVVVGAQVSATDAAGKTATVPTDNEGRFKLSGLAPGTYTVVVVSAGFAEARREQVAVEEGRAARVDFQLQVVLDAGTVTVTAGAKPGRGDATYQQLRNAAAAPESFTTYASVNNLVLKRDAATFTLRSGELYFLAPVEGRVPGAVFLGEGEFALAPPVEHERKSLAIFTGEPSLTEQFTRLVLRFTDKTFDEIKASPNAKIATGGAQAGRARDLFKENQTLLRRELRTNYELRALVDLYAPQRPGFFTAFVVGKRFEKLVFQVDPLGIPEVSPEEVMLRSFGESDGGIWTAFHLTDGHAAGAANGNEDHRNYDIKRHEIEARIEGTKIVATDRVTLRPLSAGLRVLPFRLFRTLRVARVADEQGREFEFVQESRDADADFGVILPEPLETGKDFKLTVEYAGGDAILDLGGGNFYLGPRSSWYPNNSGTQFGDRAAFDVTFNYGKGKTLIGTGALAEPPKQEGDRMIARWSSGGIDLAVSGFNIGRFKTKAVKDADSGYDIEFYANEELPAFMRGAEQLGSMSTTSMADRAIADAQNSTRIFNAFFGKLPYTRVAMTQQPAPNFGQAWPTLVYMPFTAFMDSTQRYLASGGNVRAATNDFYKYVGPHEVAHQWWGHTIGWTSYRDQWMSEGFAQFSTSLYVQAVHGNDKFREFWEDERELIVTSRPATRDRKPYTVGPVTQGYRLSSGKTGAAYQFLVYPKGGFILHMLRMMMFDSQQGGDRRFQAMMQDFIKTHYNKDVSTEDFKRIVQKHATPEIGDGSGRVDWFFDQWVYGTEMPSYRLEYQISGNTLSGRITQSGVSDGFRMRVPLYVDLGKGWTRLGSANITGNKTIDVPPMQLPAAPKRAAVAAFNDVLAAQIENVKK
jgi:hypothetical protein